MGVEVQIVDDLGKGDGSVEELVLFGDGEVGLAGVMGR